MIDYQTRRLTEVKLELVNDIENFNDCFSWSAPTPDDIKTPEAFMNFLTENPHFGQINDKFNKTKEQVRTLEINIKLNENKRK